MQSRKLFVVVPMQFICYLTGGSHSIVVVCATRNKVNSDLHWKISNRQRNSVQMTQQYAEPHCASKEVILIPQNNWNCEVFSEFQVLITGIYVYRYRDNTIKVDFLNTYYLMIDCRNRSKITHHLLQCISMISFCCAMVDGCIFWNLYVSFLLRWSPQSFSTCLSYSPIIPLLKKLFLTLSHFIHCSLRKISKKRQFHFCS